VATRVACRHRAGVRPCAASSELAGSCVFSKQSPLALSVAGWAPLLPRVRGQVAEFLRGHSLGAGVCSTGPRASGWVQSGRRGGPAAAQGGASRGGAARPRPPPPVTPAASHSGRCQCRDWLWRRGELAVQPLGLGQVGWAHRALLVPALTLWVRGRCLSAARPRAKRSATTAPASGAGGGPPLRPAGEGRTSSAPGGPPLPSAGGAAGELLRFR